MDHAGPTGGNDTPAGVEDAPPAPVSSPTVTASERAAGGVGADAEPGERPGATPPRTPRWLGSAVTRHLVILLAYIGAAIGFTWPRFSYLYGHELPATRDSGSYVWGFWWVARQVSHLSNPWFTRFQAAPVGAQLGFHTLMPLPGLVMTPITLAFGPSASYNLLSAITPGLLCYAMYRAARLWVRSQTGAIAAGAFFGLSSMLTFQSWYLLNLALGVLFVPLGVEAAVRLRRRPGWRQVVYLGVVVGASLLTDQESAILVIIAVILTLLPSLLLDPAGFGLRPVLARLRPVALAALVALVVASPQIVAMLQQVAAGGATIPAHDLAVSYLGYGVGLGGLFAPSPHVASLGLTGLGSYFYQHGMINPVGVAHGPLTGLQAPDAPMFGVTLPLLALVGLVVSWRRRNAWLLALLLVGCALLALGPVLWVGSHEYVPFASALNGVRVSSLMPYTWFVHLPGMSNFREAGRFAELGLVGGALLAGSAVDWLRYHARPALVLVAALGVLELGWQGNPPGRVMPSAFHVGVMPTSLPSIDRRIAADHSNSIVVDFPFGIRGGPPDRGPQFPPEVEVMATADGHPLADALISRVPSSTISGLESHPFYAGLWHTYYTPQPKYDLSPAQLAAARRDARRMNVRWIIVWPNGVRNALRRYLNSTGFTIDYRVRHVVVYHR